MFITSSSETNTGGFTKQSKAQHTVMRDLGLGMMHSFKYWMLFAASLRIDVSLAYLNDQWRDQTKCGMHTSVEKCLQNCADPFRFFFFKSPPCFPVGLWHRSTKKCVLETRARERMNICVTLSTRAALYGQNAISRAPEIGHGKQKHTIQHLGNL